MSILRVAALIFTVSMTYRVLPVLRRNISSCSGIRFVCDSCRICTQVSDHTDRAFAGNVNAFIELLRNTHCLRRREIQCLCGFLLKCTGRKGERRLLGPLARLYISYFILHSLKGCQNAVELLFRLNVDSLVTAVEMGDQRLFLTRNCQFSVKRPVLGRNKRSDLVFTIRDDPESN